MCFRPIPTSPTSGTHRERTREGGGRTGEIPGRPASLFGQSDQIRLEVTSTDIARRNVGGTSEDRRILGRPAKERPTVPTLQHHMFNFAWKLRQLFYLRPSQATAQEPTCKSYKYLPPPSLQRHGELEQVQGEARCPHMFRK